MNVYRPMRSAARRFRRVTLVAALAVVAAGCTDDGRDAASPAAEGDVVDCSSFQVGDAIPQDLPSKRCGDEELAEVSYGDCADGAVFVYLAVDGRRMEGIIGRTSWQVVAPDNALLRSCGG